MWFSKSLLVILYKSVSEGGKQRLKGKCSPALPISVRIYKGHKGEGPCVLMDRLRAPSGGIPFRGGVLYTNKGAD